MHGSDIHTFYSPLPVSSGCDRCGVSCPYQIILRNDANQLWEKLFGVDAFKGIADMIKTNPPPRGYGIGVLQLDRFSGCHMGQVMQCESCEIVGAPHKLSVSEKNTFMHLVGLWNNAIQSHGSFIKEMELHSIFFGQVFNEDMALHVNCSQELDTETYAQLASAGLCKTAYNDPQQGVLGYQSKHTHFVKISEKFKAIKRDAWFRGFLMCSHQVLCKDVLQTILSFY